MVTVYWLLLAPLTTMLLMFNIASGSEAVLVSVAVLVTLVPSFKFPKANVVADSLAMGVGTMPVPLSVSVRDPALSLSVTISVAGNDAAVVGVNFTVITHEAPAANVAGDFGQVSVDV